MLSAGSGVSLKGSPTVSPIPQVYNCSVSFSFNDSQSLFEVSQASLALDDRIATMQSRAMSPAGSMRHFGPMQKPTNTVARTASAPGAIRFSSMSWSRWSLSGCCPV